MAFLWIVTALSLLGTILNIYKVRWCFYIWTLTNAIWVIVNLSQHSYPQAALFGAYFILAVIGIFRWR